MCVSYSNSKVSGNEWDRGSFNQHDWRRDDTTRHGIKKFLFLLTMTMLISHDESFSLKWFFFLNFVSGSRRSKCVPLSRWEKWCHNCRHLDVNRCVDEQGWKSVSSCGSTFIGIRFLTPTPPTATWLCKFQFLFFAFHFGPSQPQVYTCSRFGFELFYRGVTWLNGVWMAMASKSHGQWFDIISRLCVCVCVYAGFIQLEPKQIWRAYVCMLFLFHESIHSCVNCLRCRSGTHALALVHSISLKCSWTSD